MNVHLAGSTSIYDGSYWGEGTVEDCAAEEAARTMLPPSYQDKDPADWVELAVVAWNMAPPTEAAQHSAANLFLSENVAPEDIHAISPFVHAQIHRYHDSQIFRALVDDTVNVIDAAVTDCEYRRRLGTTAELFHWSYYLGTYDVDRRPTYNYQPPSPAGTNCSE